MKRNMRNIISIFLIALIIISIPKTISAAEEYPNLILDGEVLEFKTDHFFHNNRIMIPVRPISEKLEYDVSWNDADDSILINNKLNQLSLRINDKKVKFNDREIILDTAPMIKDNTSYFPIDLISKIMYREADYDRNNKTVVIGTYNDRYDDRKAKFSEEIKFLNNSYSLNIPSKIKDKYVIKETEDNTVEFYDKHNYELSNKKAGHLFTISKLKDIQMLYVVPSYLLEYDKGDYYIVTFASDVQYDTYNIRSEKIYNEQMNHTKEFLKSFKLINK